jgi:hypothetical protein
LRGFLAVCTVCPHRPQGGFIDRGQSVTGCGRVDRSNLSAIRTQRFTDPDREDEALDRVELEDALLRAIREFDVRPRRDDWQEILGFR